MKVALRSPRIPRPSLSARFEKKSRTPQVSSVQNILPRVIVVVVSPVVIVELPVGTVVQLIIFESEIYGSEVQNEFHAVHQEGVTRVYQRLGNGWVGVSLRGGWFQRTETVALPNNA